MIVKGNHAAPAVITTSTMGTGYGKEFPWIANMSASFFAGLGDDGFSVRSSNRVNQSGLIYDWVAFAAEPGVQELGTFLLLSEAGRSADCEVVIAGAATTVREVLALMNIDRFLRLESDLESALTAIAEEAVLV